MLEHISRCISNIINQSNTSNEIGLCSIGSTTFFLSSTCKTNHVGYVGGKTTFFSDQLGTLRKFSLGILLLF